MTIALLCPTRGRPEQYARMCESVKRTTADPTNISIMGASNGGDNYVPLQFPQGYPTAAMWNEMCEVAIANPKFKLFMLAADDMVFTTPGWDMALLEHYNALENKIHVYHLQDSRDKDGTPHPIVTREYIEAMGYFLPPLFLHWFIDSWTVGIAKYNNCFTHLRDYMLEHRKPSDDGKPDDTHTRIRSMGWRERDGWVAEKMQHVLGAEKARLATHFKRHWFPSVRVNEI